MSLEIHQRYEIVFLSRHPLGPKLGLKAVANAVKCDKKTVKYWLDRWEQSKDLSDLQRSERPRGTTPEQDEGIVNMANEQVSITSNEIKDGLERVGLEVTERRVQRRLNEAGGKFNLPMSKPMLTEKHCLNRLESARANQDTNSNQFIFSDEATVFLNRVKGRVWNFPGRKKVIRTVKHPTVEAKKNHPPLKIKNSNL